MIMVNRANRALGTRTLRNRVHHGWLEANTGSSLQQRRKRGRDSGHDDLYHCSTSHDRRLASSAELIEASLDHRHLVGDGRSSCNMRVVSLVTEQNTRGRYDWRGDRVICEVVDS